MDGQVIEFQGERLATKVPAGGAWPFYAAERLPHSSGVATIYLQGPRPLDVWDRLRKAGLL